MKIWTIDEFLKECEELCWNQYTYDYSRMPKGICNGHEVEPYRGTWHSIVIDGCIHSMSVYSDEYPNGFAIWVTDGQERTALEDVRYRLMKSRKSDRVQEQKIANWIQEVLGEDYEVRYDDCESCLTRIYYTPLQKMIAEVPNSEMKSGIDATKFEASTADKAEAFARGLTSYQKKAERS